MKSLSTLKPLPPVWRSWIADGLNEGDAMQCKLASQQGIAPILESCSSFLLSILCIWESIATFFERIRAR